MSSFDKQLEEELEKRKKKKNSVTVEKATEKSYDLGRYSYLPSYTQLSASDLPGYNSSLTKPLGTSRYTSVFDTASKSATQAYQKEKDDEDDSKLDFFQKGSFEDGFDWHDIPTAILGTAGDVGLGLVKGVAKIGEGISDAVGYGVAGVADAFGHDDYAEGVRKRAQDNLIDMLLSGADDYLDQYSILGRTSDSVMEGIGQVGAIMATGGIGAAAGLSTAGVTALTTGTMGLSGLGSGMGEAYKGGATDWEALKHGLNVGATDAISELIFGGLGKAVNALGFSRGLSSADDMLAKLLGSKFKNQIASNIVEFGIKSGAEGLEEVIAGVAQAYSKHSTYMSDEDFLDILKDENLLEQFIVGAVTSGIAQAPSLHIANKTGTDFVTGLNQNEQAVIKKVVESRIAEQEAEGKTLTKKEKADIEADVLQDMEKGYISTNTIEEVLGGDKYTAYQDTIKQENDALAELAELYEGDELKQKAEEFLSKSKRNEMAKTLSDSVYDMVKDSRLGESYRDRARRGQRFEADVSKYDEKQRVTIQRAIDSGVLNNTNRTHDMVDFIARVSADTGVLFDFTNNEKLKDSIFGINGKTVDGYITKDGITINVNSPRYINTIVGHEITHAFEGTAQYEVLEKAVFEYAKEKGTYKDFLKEAYELYHGEEGYEGYEGLKKIKKEAVANLVGEYLFTDKNFISHLSAKHQNIFQKAWNEVKYMVKIARAGSNEHKKLLEMQKAFEEVYRNGGKTPNEAKHSLSIKHTDGSVEELADARSLTNEQSLSYLEQAKAGSIQRNSYIPVRKDTPQVIIDALEQVDEKIENRSLVMQVRKAQQAMSAKNPGKQSGKHGDNVRPHALKPEQIVEIINNLDEPSTIIYQTNRVDKNGKQLPNNVAAFVEYSNNGTESVAVIEFDSSIDPEYIGTEYGDTNYHTVVTVFEPDVERNGVEFDYAEELLSNPDNIELKIERRQSEGSATGEKHPNTSNELPSIEANLTQEGKNVKYSLSKAADGTNDFNSLSYAEIAEEQQKLYQKERSLSERKREVTNNPELLQAMDDVSSVFTEVRGLLSKKHNGTATQAELDRIKELKKLREERIQRVAELQESLGLNAISKEEAEIRETKEALRVASDAAWEREGAEKENIAIEKSGMSAPDYFRKKALKSFKTTANFNEAGYLLPDGRLLNFSGGERNHRYRDHREIGEIYEATNGVKALNRFMRDGNIRIMAESPGIDITSGVEPTNEQYAALRRFIKSNGVDDGRFFVDFSDADGRNVGKYSYQGRIFADRIINDIKYFYQTGKVRESSGLTDFLSLSNNNTQPTTHGNWHISGKDVAYEDIAPVAETVSKTESVAPVAVSKTETTTTELFPDDREELTSLLTNQFELRGALEASAASGDYNTMSMLTQEYENVTARIRELEAQEAERFDSIDDADAPPEMEIEHDEMTDTTPLNKKTITDLTKKVKPLLGMKNNQTGELVSVIEAYSRSEKATSEQLFKELKAKFGKFTERTVDEPTKEVKALLRGYRINVSDSIKSEIADYADLMRRNFGRVRFSKEGMAVDEVYEDLSASYPGYFPEDIINPTDQLMQIIHVANMEAETVSEMEVDDESIADAVRTIARTVRAYQQSQMQALSNREAKEAFDSLVKSADEFAPATEDDIDPVVKQKEKTAKIEKPAEIAPEGTIKTVKERLTAKMQGLEAELASNRKLREESWSDYDNEIARAQAEYNAKSNKNTMAANDLLRRIERLNRMKHNTDADYAKRISDLEARTAKVGEEVRTGQSTTEQGAMRQELHNRILSNIRTRFEERGFDFDNVLRNAKNLSTFATVDNTPQRVMEKALGYKQGQILSDLTVNQVAQNETAGIKWLNVFTDRKNGVLAKMSKQYSIKPGSKESAAAQMYAEGFYVNGKNEIVQYGDAELAQDFPNAKVRANIKGLARDPRIRMIYDGTLDRINESRARNAYPEIQRLDNYFLHFRAMDDTFSKLGIPFNPNDIKAKDLPTDLNGVTADLKPGQPYFASAMHRTGKRTSFDLLGGLERYLSSAKNQIYHIDDIQTLRALRNYVADTYGQAHGLESLDLLTEEEAQERIEKVYGSHLSTFAKFLNEEANVIAGKTALIDRGLEGVIGRRGITFLDTVNKQVGSNMVGFNVSSSLTNILPVAQTLAKTNKFDFVKAFAQTISNKVGSVFGKGDGFAENSPVIIRRKGEERFYRTPWQKAGDAGYMLMGAVDDISTELIARTKYNELTRKGMDSKQAHIETDKWVSRLMGDRSLGQQPQLYNSKMLGMITKFQLEVRNQLDAQFYDTIQETKASNEDIQNGLLRNAKTAAKIGSTFFQLAVVQHLFGKAFESVAGYNPAFDIISVLIKAFGWDDDDESEDTVLDNIEEGFLELMGDLPYTSTLTGGRIPISSALPVQQFVTGKDQYGNEKSRWETLASAAPYYVLPGGYGQVKKTYQGLSMFDDDLPVSGSYTDSGNLRFPVEDTFGNRVQAGIFGQYASANARDYFDNERSPLRPNQIQEYIDVDLPIREYWDYREGLSEHQTLDAKGDYIGGLDLPISKKNILINNIAKREESIDMADYSKYPNFHEFDWAEQNEEKYAFLQDHGMSYADYEKLDEDSKKAYTWAYNNPEKYAFVKEQGLSATEYYSLDDDTKDAYGWAYNNPEKFTVSKAISNDFLTYYQYKTDLSKLNAKDENGETVSGLKKERVIDYINNLDIDYGQKIILFRSMYDGKADQEAYNADIVDYLNSRDDISYEEMVAILKELGFTVHSDGTVTW